MCFFGTMITELLFVFSYSAFKFVYEAVDGGIHIFFGVISVNRTTVYIYSCFRLVAQFLDRKDTIHIRYKVKVAFNFFDLRLNVSSEGIGNFDVMA